MTAAAIPGQGVPPVFRLPQAQRYLTVLGVVGFWMGLGWLLHLNPNSYLVAGVPLLVIFQLAVARRPISELWVRPAISVPFPLWGYAAAAAFMIAPGLELSHRWPQAGWSMRLWFCCAIAGAIPLAFAFTRVSRLVLKSTVLCFATAGVLGVASLVAVALLRHRLDHLSATRAVNGVWQFLLYLPVSFILEEVFFRGGLDSYLHTPGDRAPWLSAAVVSIIWGLWHLPASGAHSLPRVVVLIMVLPIVHCLVGIPFSFFWRSSGSLLVPAVVHSFIDSVRNVLLH